MFCQKLYKLSQSIIFPDFFACVEESNYTKDYMKARRERSGNERLLFFCIGCSLVSIICQKRASESEQYTQYTRLKRLIMKYLTQL